MNTFKIVSNGRINVVFVASHTNKIFSIVFKVQSGNNQGDDCNSDVASRQASSLKRAACELNRKLPNNFTAPETPNIVKSRLSCDL